MKKLLKMHSYLIQPTIYKIISRVFLGVTFSLLWDHFINKNKTYRMVENAFFFVGAILLTMAWFNYLNLDGFSMKGKKGKDKPKRKSKHQSKSMIDFVDEEVTNNELEKDDEITSSMIANIFTGICFLIPSIIASFKI